MRRDHPMRHVTSSPRHCIGASFASGAVALAAVFTGGSPAVAAPMAATATNDAGLFGSQDPSFDGVFRQSMAILGLIATEASVPISAVDWLLDQQCPDGSFVSYRAEPSQPCPAADPSTFTGPDTNSTAVAALALAASSNTSASRTAIRWLADTQNEDGGWPYLAGTASDSSSTGLALAAMRGADIPRARATKQAAFAFLHTLVATCTAPISDRFGLSYQAGANVDAFSSTQGLLGLSGTLPARTKEQRRGGPMAKCAPDGEVLNDRIAVARWSMHQINANNGGIPSSFSPGETDWNSTAIAVLGLVNNGFGGNATDLAVGALQANVTEYISGDGDRAAALGTTLLVTAATGENPRSFGGVNLVKRLKDTLQR
jgi:hypothetical protein